MRVCLVVAMAENRVIGVGNTLPWHLSADLQRFKAITMGKPVLMGRRTHESIGRPLPGRTNIVLTSNVHYTSPGCVVVHSLSEALSRAEPAFELMVIGGSALYAALLPRADRIYLTLIHRAYRGDVEFPEIAWDTWHETVREDIDDDPGFGIPYSFLVLDRRPGTSRPGPTAQ
jgi:dihydrofolate reductase